MTDVLFKSVLDPDLRQATVFQTGAKGYSEGKVY
jgi:hypothetical protein